jgi:hypothetical protein
MIHWTYILVFLLGAGVGYFFHWWLVNKDKDKDEDGSSESTEESGISSSTYGPKNSGKGFNGNDQKLSKIRNGVKKQEEKHSSNWGKNGLSKPGNEDINLQQSSSSQNVISSNDPEGAIAQDANNRKKPFIPPSHFEEERIPIVVNKKEELIKLYNDDPASIRYQPNLREFTVANMQLMGKDHDVEPDYRIVDPNQPGEYWLIEIDNNLYALPRNKNTYNIGQFQSGGLNRVFKCEGLRLGYRYRKIEIKKLAEFRDKGSGSLELLQPGILKLSNEEEES